MLGNLQRFAAHRGLEELHNWADTAPEEFWPAVWRFCGVQAETRWETVRSGPLWFAGARLNFAANLLRFQDDEPGLHAPGRTYTHRQLYAEVSLLEQALRASGIGPGDEVGSTLGDTAGALIALLATAAIGARWRPGSVESKVVFTDAETLQGRPRTWGLAILETGSAAGLDHALTWKDETLFSAPRRIRFESLPFSHPLTEHSAGGILLQGLKESVLEQGVRMTETVWREDSPVLRACILATGAALALPGSGQAARMLETPEKPLAAGSLAGLLSSHETDAAPAGAGGAEG